jgi:ribonuclease HI
MFSQLQRVLEFPGEIGDAWSSTTGVPEGCAMSSISMLTLSVWVAEHLQQTVQSPDIVCMTYADNWALVTDCFTQLQTGVDALVQLVQSLHMTIAADKSWVWATHRSQRAQLSALLVDGCPVPMKMVATELGCDVSYCRKITKTSTKKRLMKTSRVLKRVSTKKLPKRFKATMTQLFSGISGYGSELVHHSVSDLRLVRTAVCRAIGRSRAGNSPYLSTFLTQGLEDVSVTMLMRKVMFWRRYFKIFPEASSAFLNNLVTGRHQHGGSAFLRRTFQDHGWSCGAAGELEHVRGWKVNWMSNSKGHLRKMFLLSWNLNVCDNVKHRTNFDVDMIDVPAFHQALGKLEDTAKTDAMNLATGKHVTNNALVHYKNGTKDHACPLCKKKDSREHRVWHCAGTQQFRDKYPAVLQWLQTQPKAVAEFGILPVDVSWIDWRYCQAHFLPDVDTLADEGTPRVHVFTDGSTVGQGLAGHAIAAAAYVRCEGYNVVAKKAEPIPGVDHSAFRAEIWGIIMALRDHYSVHIYTDCASVIDNLQLILQAKKVNLNPAFNDHEDLWNRVWKLVASRDADCVHITKVKAHQNLAMVSGAQERWMDGGHE